MRPWGNRACAVSNNAMIGHADGSRRGGALVLAIGLPLIAAVVSFAAIWMMLRHDGLDAWYPASIAAVLGAIGASFAGIPAAYWAISSGRRQLWMWTVMGAAAGAVPSLVVLTGGVLGALVRGDTLLLRVGVTRLLGLLLGAVGIPLSLTMHGVWSLELLPVAVGAVTAILFWLAFVRTG